MKAPRLDEAFARSPRMVHRRIGAERVLVPLVGRGAGLDSIFSLNRVAAFVWEALDGARTGDDVVRRIVEAFEVEPERAAADHLELVETLLEIGAVEPSPRR